MASKNTELSKEIIELLKKHVSIDGSDNVIGDNNHVEIRKLEGGDYSIIIGGDLNVDISKDDLRSIVPPLQLPSKVVCFVNRKKELRDILAKLTPNNIVSIHGPGGIGKTATVSELLWQLAPNNSAPENFPDGIISIDLRDGFYSEAIFSHILRSFGEAEEALNSKLLDKREKKTVNTNRGSSLNLALGRVLAKKKSIIVLYSADNVDRNDIPDLRYLYQVQGQSSLILISKKKGSIHTPGEWIPIQTLENEHATQLLRYWSETRREEDNANLKEISQLLGGLPLALRSMGSYIIHYAQKPELLLERLKKSIIGEIEEAEDLFLELLLILDDTFRSIEKEETQKLYALMGVLGNSSFDLETIIAVSKDSVSSEVVSLRLGELVSRSTLQYNQENERYILSHSLMHKHAKEKAIVSSNKDLALTNLIEYFHKKVESWSYKDLHQFSLDEPHILVALQTLKERISPSSHQTCQLMIDFVNLVEPFWGYLSKFQRQIDWLEIAFECAQFTGDKYVAAALLRKIGRAYGWLGKLDKGLEKISEIDFLTEEEKSIDQNGVIAHMYIHRASIYFQKGKLKNTFEDCNNAIELISREKHPHIYAESYNLLGAAQGSLGKFKEAGKSFKESLAIWRELKDEYQVYRVEDNIRNALYYSGFIGQLRSEEEKSLDYWSKYPERMEYAMALTNRGLTHHIDGDFKQSIELQLKAIDVSDKLKIHRMRALSRLNIAWPYLTRGIRENKPVHVNEAEKYLQESLAFDSGEFAIDAKRCLAEVEIGRKQYEKAVDLAEKTLSLVRDENDPEDIDPLEEGAVLRILGQAHRLKGNLADAQENLEESFATLGGYKDLEDDNEDIYRYEAYLTAYELCFLYEAINDLDKLDDIRKRIGILRKKVGLAQDHKPYLYK